MLWRGAFKIESHAFSDIPASNCRLPRLLSADVSSRAPDKSNSSSIHVLLYPYTFAYCTIPLSHFHSQCISRFYSMMLTWPLVARSLRLITRLSHLPHCPLCDLPSLATRNTTLRGFIYVYMYSYCVPSSRERERDFFFFCPFTIPSRGRSRDSLHRTPRNAKRCHEKVK